MTALGPTLQAFFSDRLIRERHASAHTVAAYRDTWRLLLSFAADRTRRPPCDLDIDDLDTALISAFLDHLEHDRHNSVRTRNTRLAAIHSLFRYAALRHPEHAATIRRVLAIPPKRFDRAIITYLTVAEVDAILGAPTRPPGPGVATRRSSPLPSRPGYASPNSSDSPAVTSISAPARTSAVTAKDARTASPRSSPQPSHAALVAHRTPRPTRRPAVPHPARPTTQPRRHRAPPRRSRRHRNPTSTLHDKRVTAHVLRHTAAMRLLEAGVDTTVIALWLGHEQVDTTAIYLHAHLGIKERALARTTPADVSPGRYQPTDNILAFLEAL